MGYRLRRDLREVLGPEIKGMPRAVALEIADDARDETRLSFASLENLRRWTAAKDTNVVRDALKRLAAAGWEFRVPIGKGKDGRLLYAVPGTRVTFRVPDFEGVVTTRPKGESGLPLEGVTTDPVGTEGVVVTPSEGVVTPSEGVTTTPFSSCHPSSSENTSARELASSKQQRKGKPSPAGPILGDVPHLDDIEAVCEHLADVLVKTGSKRPKIDAKWRTAARGLIDGDGVTPEQAIAAIDWAHANYFWQAHILTPAKLSKNYDTLRRQAIAEQRRGSSGQQRGGARVQLPAAEDINNTRDEDIL